MYYQRKKKTSHPLFSLALILCFVALSVFLWKTLISSDGVSQNTEIHLPASGTLPSIRLGKEGKYATFQDVDRLFEGEAIRTGGDGVSLRFFDGTVFALDTESEIDLLTVKKNIRDNSTDILVSLPRGRIWGQIQQSLNPNSQVRVENSRFALSSRGAVFSLDQESISVLSGSVIVRAGEKYERVVEVGQSLLLSEEDIAQIQAGRPGPEKGSLSPALLQSDWFLANNAQGSVERGTTSSSFGMVSEEEPGTRIRITSPGRNNESVETSALSHSIQGIVPKSTVRVMVNDHVLTKYSPGDTSFRYIAATDIQTLHLGKNLYTIVAVDEDGTESMAKITLVLQDTEETQIPTNNTPDVSSGSSDIVDTSPASGELSILSPSEGSTSSEATILVSGTAPSRAYKIVVNNYTLSKYIPGSPTWNYIMSDSLGNRTLGATTVVVKALGKNGEILGTITRTFTVLGVPADSAASHIPELRENTLPPVKQDDFGDPTI